MLTTDTEAPEVTETTMSTDLLQALQIVTQLGVQVVGSHLGVFAVTDVLLPVEEPVGYLELAGIADDGDQTFHLFLGELAGAFVEVNIGLLADNVGESTADTLDGGKSEHNLAVTVNVRVHHTKNVLESVRDDEGHRGSRN